MGGIMDEKLKIEIEGLLKADEITLYKVIGSSVPQESREHPPGKEEDEGRSWFQNNIDKIRGKICGNNVLTHLVSSDSWDDFVLAAAIVDAFSVPIFNGVPVSQVSVFIVKYGVKRLCINM
jgi:hypothetical protein